MSGVPRPKRCEVPFEPHFLGVDLTAEDFPRVNATE